MTSLIMAAILLFGIVGYRSLPVSDLPNVDFPTILVTASLPGASPETSFVVGDTSFDMAMAAAAGATPIGAGWGYHDPQELIEAGAIAVAERPFEVLSLIPEQSHG